MKYLSILTILLISGCSSQSFTDKVSDQIIEQVTGKEYSRNSSQCPAIKKHCSAGSYEEWINENGVKSCACN